jgi:hypothetical protein
MTGSRVNGSNAWSITKEKILFFAGLAIIAYEIIVPELLGEPFHFEVLITGLALCGVSVTQWGDKKVEGDK